jgi:hypothetical protein
MIFDSAAGSLDSNHVFASNPCAENLGGGTGGSKSSESTDTAGDASGSGGPWGSDIDTEESGTVSDALVA